MKRLNLVLAILVGSTFAAFAHSPLKSTLPADQTNLTELPEGINLTFTKPARVTKVTLTHTNADAGHTDKLELPTKKFTKVFDLKPQFRGVGQYKVDWRALGQDGHVLKGKFMFTVSEE